MRFSGSRWAREAGGAGSAAFLGLHQRHVHLPLAIRSRVSQSQDRPAPGLMETRPRCPPPSLRSRRGNRRAGTSSATQSTAKRKEISTTRLASLAEFGALGCDLAEATAGRVLDARRVRVASQMEMFLGHPTPAARGPCSRSRPDVPGATPADPHGRAGPGPETTLAAAARPRRVDRRPRRDRAGSGSDISRLTTVVERADGKGLIQGVKH